MSQWFSHKIGELGRVVTGKTPPSTKPEFFDGDIPFLTPSDMSDTNRDVQAERFVSDAWDAKQRQLLPAGSTCVVCIGATIGKVCMTNRPSHTNQQVNSIIPDKGKFDPKFVFYSMRTLGPELRARAAGAATPILNKSAFAEVEISAPSLATQRRIASILGAYDDLIEVNRRRVAILEEMARGLFEEWFVRFRFPGHESVPMVATSEGLLPDGWQRMAVENLIQRVPVKKRYSQKTALSEGKVPILDQGKSGVIGYHNDAPSVVAGVENPVIVFANHTCYQKVVHFSFSAIQNVLPFVPSKPAPQCIYWLHHATSGLVHLNDYKGHWPELMSKRIPMPTHSIAERFDRFVRPLHLSIYRLQEQIEHLAAFRDLLLPRLISGQLSVEGAERELEAAA